ncbi:MAG: hypothetical protein R3C42_05110 [Parvularculaceae bacterium]|nr:hypothetical protein [Parvularculaceae bacterium]
MLKRTLSGIIGGGTAINGAIMLAAGRYWYDTTPSVADTGPFNPHFVADIGAAYVVAGLSLLARAIRPEYWPAAVAGAAFFAAHAIIHVIGLFGGHSHHAGFEWAMVVIPAIVSLWAAFPSKGEK